MMEYEKVCKLIDAGFTKAEIEEMLKPAEEPAKDEETKPEKKLAEEPAKAADQDTNKLVLDAINNLTKTIQANAFFRDGGNGGAGGETAQEILAGMFADPHAKDKK